MKKLQADSLGKLNLGVLAGFGKRDLLYAARLMDQCYLEGLLDACHSLGVEPGEIFERKVEMP